MEKKENEKRRESIIIKDPFIYSLRYTRTTTFRVATNDKENDQISLFIHCHIAVSTSIHIFSLKRTSNGKYEVMKYK